MPGFFDTPDDPFTAALEQARAGYRSKGRAALMEPKSDEHLAETADESLPKNQGAFQAGLNWIGRFGQVGKNLAGSILGTSGSLEGAARQAADIVGEAIDAPIPGDWIPQFSRPQDEVTGADVEGISKDWQKEHPLLALGAGLPADIFLDPLTYTGFGLLGKAAVGVGKGAEALALASKIPKAEEAIQALKAGAATAGVKARSILGAQRLTPEAQSALGAASAAKGNEAQAGLSAIKGSESLNALIGDEPKIVGDIIDNFKWGENKLPSDLYGGLAKGEQGPLTSALDPNRIAAHPGVNPDNIERITKAVQDTIDIGQNQALRPGIFNPESLPKEYLARGYKGQTEEQAINEVLGRGPEGLGSPGAAKGRTLEGAEDVASYLGKNPKVEYERNAIARLAQRAQAQGSLAGRAEIGRKLLGDAFTLTDDTQRSAVTEKIRQMAASADPIEQESAKVLHDAFHGLAPRGALTDALARVNRVVKPMMVYGFAIPKFGSIVRNKISGIWQAASTPAARGVALEQAKRLPSDLYGAVVDSLGLKVGKDKLGQAGALIEDAFSKSKGAAKNASDYLRQSAGAGGYTGQELADVVDSGAISGFVSSEDLIKSMAASPRAAKWKSVTEWPGRMFKGVEDRMRTGMALDLLRKGKTADEIGQIVRDSMYDYSVSSTGNRTARDILPFANYSMKAGVQQAKLLQEKPWLAVALSSLLTEKQGQATYPYMSGRLNIPLGADEQGNQQYASGLGLPFEALNMIPNLSGSPQDAGRDVGRTLVGSTQPLLKTAGSLIFGNDPTFGTPAGSYSKLPGNIEGGGIGRAYNLAAGAGLTQPIESLVRTAGKLADDRGSAGTKALDLLSGANVVSVDPDRALQQRLTNYLRNRPDIASVQSLYSKTKDPEGLALIKALNEAKKRSKVKRAIH